MAETTHSVIVRLTASLREGNYWVVTSDNLPGLLLCGKDRHQLFADVPSVVQKLMELNYGLHVQVAPLVEPQSVRRPIHETFKEWVAWPMNDNNLPTAGAAA